MGQLFQEQFSLHSLLSTRGSVLRSLVVLAVCGKYTCRCKKPAITQLTHGTSWCEVVVKKTVILRLKKEEFDQFLCPHISVNVVRAVI